MNKPNDKDPSLVEVFESGHLWQIDTVREALKEADIPCLVRQMNPGGYSTAFQVMPTPNAGVSWIIQVAHEDRAKVDDILAQLPIERDKKPGFYDFTSEEVVKKWGFMNPWVFLALIVAAGAATVYFRACSP